MKKQILKITLLFMLIFLVACSTDGNISGNTDKLKIIANSELARVFDGANNDKSITIEKVSGTAGIVADEIVFKVLAGTFQSNPDVAVTFDTADDDGGKKITAMTKSVKQAVEAILNVAGNNIEGLSKETRVAVDIDRTTATALVTIIVDDDYAFEDKTTTKTFIIILTGEGVRKTVISNNLLASTFNNATEDKSLAVNKAVGKAGITADAITLNAQKGVFVDNTEVAILFNATDNTNVKQITAIINSVNQAVDTMLAIEANHINGLSEDVTVLADIASTTEATATVTINVYDGFEFEDRSTSKTFTIGLTNNAFVGAKIILNATLATAFDGGDNDKSATLNQASGDSAGIAAGEIVLKVNASGVFQNDTVTALTFHANDNTLSKKESVVKNSIIKTVTPILTTNNVEGLSVTIKLEDLSIAEMIDKNKMIATVSIKALQGYKFEDKTTVKTFEITFNSENFGDSFISEGAINIPKVDVTERKAGITAFTIPAGFKDVNSGANATFHKTIYQTAKKKTVLKTSINAINISSVQGLKIKSVSNATVNTGNTKAEITVTFEPEPGYKFKNGATTKVVKITVAGDFKTSGGTIKEIAFQTSSKVEMTDKLPGINEAIIFNAGFIQKEGNSPKLTFPPGLSFVDKKIVTRISIEKLFLHTITEQTGGKFPEGVTIGIDDLREEIFTDTGATYKVTFEALPGYKFPDNKPTATTREATIKVSF